MLDCFTNCESEQLRSRIKWEQRSLLRFEKEIDALLEAIESGKCSHEMGMEALMRRYVSIQASSAFIEKAESSIRQNQAFEALEPTDTVRSNSLVPEFYDQFAAMFAPR